MAEDLGCVNDRVRRLLKFVGYPGMKVLSFGFGGDEENPHLPKNYDTNCVAYTGTHDNDTVGGWIATADEKTLRQAKDMLGFERNEDGPWAFDRRRDASAVRILPCCPCRTCWVWAARRA